jgi:hypothetical protein
LNARISEDTDIPTREQAIEHYQQMASSDPAPVVPRRAPETVPETDEKSLTQPIVAERIAAHGL